MNHDLNLQFKVVPESEYPQFREDVKRIFAIVAHEMFGHPDKDVISDDAINESLNHKNAKIFHVYEDDVKVAGLFLLIDTETHHNKLEKLFVYPNIQSKGLGTRIWNKIEADYPETKVWELFTPYHEKRNVHFYVNKCGFKIVEFFNEYHPNHHIPDCEHPTFPNEFLRFVKEMK